MPVHARSLASVYAMVTAIYHRTSRVITWRATRGRISHLAANGICFLPPAAFPRLVHSILHDRARPLCTTLNRVTEKPRSFVRGWRDESSAWGGRVDEISKMPPVDPKRTNADIRDRRDLRPLILIFVLTTRQEKRGINLETPMGWLSHPCACLRQLYERDLMNDEEFLYDQSWRSGF